MLRISRVALLVMTWTLLGTGVAWGEAVRTADTVLPKTTVGCISATSYDDLIAHWKKTQIGKLVADPVMKPFETDVRRQIKKKWAGVSERLGVKLEDLEGVVGGEVALALIAPKEGEAATVMLLGVAGRQKQALAMLAKARTSLLAEGATEKQETIDGATVSIYTLPLPKEEQTAAPKDGKTEAPAAAADEPARQTIYFLTKDLLGASDNLAVVRGMLGRLAAGKRLGSLAEVPAYQQVMKRCASDAQGKVPQVRWFIYPLGYAAAARAATPKAERRTGKTILEVMRHQGIGAIQGVGGYVDFSSDGFEIIHRTAIYAPPPYSKSMKMFLLPNHVDFTPQPWVSREIATYTTVYIDLLNAFDNLAWIYDEMIGEAGAWRQMIRGMKEDPYGPQIDLREELIKQLGKRVTIVSDYRLPINTTSERLLFAIEVKNEKAVAKAIEKSLKNDPSAKKRTIDGRVVWEIVEEEEPKVPSISLDVPSLATKKESPKGKEEKDDEGDEKESHFLPHEALTVAQGHLLIASHLDFLVKVIKPTAAANMLRNNREFQQVWNAPEKLGMKQQCGREFSWTDEEIRPTYELIRQGKMPESESMLGRALNTISGAAKKGTVRQQRISGRNLPEYQVVRRSLGPATLSAISEPDGWFLKGFLLPR